MRREALRTYRVELIVVSPTRLLLRLSSAFSTVSLCHLWTWKFTLSTWRIVLWWTQQLWWKQVEICTNKDRLSLAKTDQRKIYTIRRWESYLRLTSRKWALTIFGVDMETMWRARNDLLFSLIQISIKNIYRSTESQAEVVNLLSKTNTHLGRGMAEQV